MVLGLIPMLLVSYMDALEFESIVEVLHDSDVVLLLVMLGSLG
jgi:hypothetical protein